LVFESERVFGAFRNLILTSFFHNFWKVWNRTISKFSVNSECSVTPVLTPKPSITGFLNQKQKIICKLFCELFSQNFCEFEKTGHFRKISELQKPNYSKTRENEKFRKFPLSQGLNKLSLPKERTKWEISSNGLSPYKLSLNKRTEFDRTKLKWVKQVPTKALFTRDILAHNIAIKR